MTLNYQGMKKLFVVAILGITFTSCTKEYKCHCVDGATNEENQMLFKTNSKSSATRLCDDYNARVKNAIKPEYTCKIQ